MRRAPKKATKGVRSAGRAARAPRDRSAKLVEPVRFMTKLLRPADTAAAWTFLMLPRQASKKLPSRGMVSVTGTLNGAAFAATLEPDGNGGHWLKVERTLREAAGAEPGDEVCLEIAPVPSCQEPEPVVPTDFKRALAAAPAKAREVWAAVTPIARRDWVQWVTSAKRDETRAKRIASACDMLANGKRRPCCFDRSGMYGKSLSCPAAENG